MRLLLVPANYPHANAQWSGIFNERSAVALRDIGNHVEVLTPRPYAPRFLAFSDRWRPYSLMPKHETRKGVAVHRPGYPRIPRIFRTFWATTVAFTYSRKLAARLHRTVGFDAILSFDLAGAGGIAWRLGRELGIPASGWATGSDVRQSVYSRAARSLRRTLNELDIVFYQSRELKSLAATLLNLSEAQLPHDRHVVQPRGIISPEVFPNEGVRRLRRARLEISDEEIVVLYLGRIARQKGLFDLVAGFEPCIRAHQKLRLLLVGSRPGHDETPHLQRSINASSLSARVKILPGCLPEQIWEYFRAADIFVFPSFREGMPNSLLEAMLAGLPAVAFGIPSVQEILRFGDGLVEIPPFDFRRFGDAILELAANPSLRQEVGDRARSIASEHFSIHKSMSSVVRHLKRIVER